MNELELRHGHRKGETFKNGSTNADRKYIDFIVSGQSLGQLYGLPDFDLIGTLRWQKQQDKKPIINNRISHPNCNPASSRDKNLKNLYE